MNNIFDQLTAKPATSTDTETGPAEPNPVVIETDHYTPRAIKAALQELLKFGLLEAERKPQLYQTAVTQAQHINQRLEPLDLHLHLDEVRGLAYLRIASEFVAADEHDDEWSHPLVRRQRLTLEQSLLLAILRQHYVVLEQESGIGASHKIAIDELLAQLNQFLGDSGSDSRDEKRLRNLLENLRQHGVVSEIDAQDQVSIRPIITHLANPESLQNLLQHYREIAKSQQGEQQ